LGCLTDSLEPRDGKGGTNKGVKEKTLTLKLRVQVREKKEKTGGKP